jgi:toxin ParE1/3/4
MTRAVLLTDAAARDLDELYAAAYERGGGPSADLFLDQIQYAVERLATRAEGGDPLPELRDLGLRDDLQLRGDPHRVVYRVRGDEVHVVLIAPWGRSLQSLLKRRMLDT